jgi:hypothetical protein
MRHFKNYSFLFFILFTLHSFGQESPRKTFGSRLSDKLVGEPVFTSKHHGSIINPLFYYTPETRFALGLSTVFFFRLSKKDTAHRPSVTHPFFGYTQNHQSFVEAPFQLFIKKEQYYLYGELAFYNYPYRFFGIGNKQAEGTELTYNALYPSCSLTVLRKVIPKFYLGFRYNFDYYTVKFDTSNALYHQNFTGKNGGLNNGIGLQALYDSRDNIFSSTRGTYIEFMSIFDSKYSFSDFNYQWFVLDMRKFQPINQGKGGVLAMQYFTNVMTGDPPFYQMSLLGGPKRMRGYYEGRYRDKDIMSTQVEYRSPFWKRRLGFAAFAGTGLVFPNFAAFDLHYLKPSIGGGLRIKFNRKEHIHFRIEVAYGKSFNYYFVLSEAF